MNKPKQQLTIDAQVQAARHDRSFASTPEAREKAEQLFHSLWAKAREQLEQAIREILRAGRVPLGALPTEAAILYAVRELDVITPWASSCSRSLARQALLDMIGDRKGAETQGEIIIVGYSGGSEVYGLRS